MRGVLPRQVNRLYAGLQPVGGPITTFFTIERFCRRLRPGFGEVKTGLPVAQVAFTVKQRGPTRLAFVRSINPNLIQPQRL